MAIIDELMEAKSIVMDAELPPELRPLAFEHALKRLRGEGLSPEEPGGASSPPPGDGPLQKIGARLSLDASAVQSVFDLDGDELTIIVPTSRLQSAKSGAAKQLALLLASGRQALGQDDGNWTPVSAIRPLVQQFGKLDSGNFSGSIKEMDDVFLYRGPSSNREVRVTEPGFERAAELVKVLAAAQ